MSVLSRLSRVFSGHAAGSGAVNSSSSLPLVASSGSASVGGIPGPDGAAVAAVLDLALEASMAEPYVSVAEEAERYLRALDLVERLALGMHALNLLVDHLADGGRLEDFPFEQTARIAEIVASLLRETAAEPMAGAAV